MLHFLMHHGKYYGQMKINKGDLLYNKRTLTMWYVYSYQNYASFFVIKEMNEGKYFDFGSTITCIDIRNNEYEKSGWIVL